MNLFFSCGVGDFVALESFLTDKEKENTSRVYLATRAADSIAQLAPFVFPHLKEITVPEIPWGKPFSTTFCITKKEELKTKFNHTQDLTTWHDFGVVSLIDEIKKGKRTFNRSTLIEKKLTPLSKFNLPKNYFVIHPNSYNAPTVIRDLTDEEWRRIQTWLQKRKQPYVILNKCGKTTPVCSLGINLANATNLLEAIEISKKASGYLGCASAFSVVVSKLNIPHNNIFIKGHQDLRDNFTDFYYQPMRHNRVFTSLLNLAS